MQKKEYVRKKDIANKIHTKMEELNALIIMAQKEDLIVKIELPVIRSTSERYWIAKVQDIKEF